MYSEDANQEPPMSATDGTALRAVPTQHPENVRKEIWNLPNSLTLLRIFLVPLLVVVLLTKYSDFVGLAIFLVAAITDFFDGYFARRLNKTTRLGALLDPIADKLLMSAAFISLVELGLAKAWMVVIIIGREFAVSGLRSIAAQRGVTIAASPLGKTKMVTQVIAISLLIVAYELGEFRFTSEIALWLVMLFALVSGVDYFIKFARAVLREDHPA
jgi:CDP-diacylglycerol---glycerol-3-phosphate 3-phosphatidyltransferase